MAIAPTYNNRLAADPFTFLDQVFGNAGARTHASLMRAPETDVVETEREIRVHVEMPGLKRENIEVDVENNVLTIRGEKREERTEGQDGRYHLAERRWGTFARSFVLPRDVDAENIQAAFENGVLLVSIPKSEKARRRKIEVGGNAQPQELGSSNPSTGNGNGEQQNG
ncbi:MAG TPA: Hsp20/alpha crystallin family protein [Longimicrobium sp.]|nr:Hsp20/alpha crystallin family protein [Longimicrobium sp.]